VSDVLTITVPIEGTYAGVNDVANGWGAKAKSTAYLTLFRATREAARAEMERVGWETARYACAVEVIRYHRTRQMNDATNLGKCEADAMAPSTPKQEARDKCVPFAGVYANDRLARPYGADVEYDAEGIDRVVIIVRRRFPDVLAVAAAKPRTARAARPTPPITPVIIEPTRIRTIKEIKNGDLLSFEERDRLLHAIET
jgi:hypothetical protein